MHLITGLNQGGAESTLVRLLLGLEPSEARHHAVVSLSGPGYNSCALRRAGFDLTEIGLDPRWPSPLRFLRLVRLLRRHRPLVVMTWLYHADLLGAVLQPLMGSPRLIWNLRCGVPDVTAAGDINSRLVAVLAHLSSRPDAVASNSYAGRDEHAASGYHPRRWVYLPNSIDPERWRPDRADREQIRRELGLDKHKLVFVMVARVEPPKDHQTLLRAFERVLQSSADVHLVLVGRGTEQLPLDAELRGHVSQLGARSDVERLLRGCDIAVLSSRSEGFPNVLLEAMATGLPCVSTDVGDAARLLNGNGIVVEAGCPQALARAMLELIRMPRQELQRLGADARRMTTDAFSPQAMLAAYRQVWYGELEPSS